MKKWLRTFLTICIPLLLLYSCEGYRCAEGVVRDKITFAPIDSAKINVLTSEDKVKYTDTTGVFNVCNYMGGCVPRCKEITIQISKPGYKDVTLTSPDSGDVFLEKL